MLAALASANPPALADAQLPRLAALDTIQRERLEERLSVWPVPRRVAALAFLQVGTPYALGPLGEGAPPDTDPVLQLRTTDCTALLLTSSALAHAREAGGELAAMVRENYRGDTVSYATRFHFTTDRLDHSPWERDLTEEVGGPLCRRREVVLNRRAAGGTWIPIDWTRARVVSWLPRESAAHFASWFDSGRLPEVVGIAFVDSARLADGLDVVHESLLWRGRTLVHASSLRGRVVTTPWTGYLEGPGRRASGVVLFGFR